VIGVERLDQYLLRSGLAQSRRIAAALIADGRVLINGHSCRKGDLIDSAADRVEVCPGRPEPAGLPAKSNVTLEILYEDAGLLVVAKPPLIPCHPLKSAGEPTVITLLARDYPEVAKLGDKPLEGGLIHRLDNGTSGALMVARTAESLALMREALRAGRIYRRYEALIEGKLEVPLELSWPIAHHRKNPARMVAAGDSLMMDPLDSEMMAAGDSLVSPNASRARKIVRAPYRGTPRDAFSRVEPITQIANFTLVNVVPRSGRRHQIRVHLAAAGHPIANDELYGGPRLARLAEGRFWLHLAELRFTSPLAREVHLMVPNPDDFRELLGPERDGTWR
jgi:23S rRNA pseudouridine1911/1915/1917 synthase